MFTFKWFITSNFKEEKLDNSFRLQLILSLGCVHAYLQRHIVDGIWTQEIKKTSNGKCLPRSEIGNAFVRARKLLIRRGRRLKLTGHVSSLSCHAVLFYCSLQWYWCVKILVTLETLFLMKSILQRKHNISVRT